jgi:hypothetical protein
LFGLIVGAQACSATDLALDWTFRDFNYVTAGAAACYVNEYMQRHGELPKSLEPPGWRRVLHRQHLERLRARTGDDDQELRELPLKVTTLNIEELPGRSMFWNDEESFEDCVDTVWQKWLRSAREAEPWLLAAHDDEIHIARSPFDELRQRRFWLLLLLPFVWMGLAQLVSQLVPGVAQERAIAPVGYRHGTGAGFWAGLLIAVLVRVTFSPTDGEQAELHARQLEVLSCYHTEWSGSPMPDALERCIPEGLKLDEEMNPPGDEF